MVRTNVEPKFSFAPDGRWFSYSSVRDGAIEIWPYPITKEANPRRLRGHQDAVEAISISKDSTILASVSLDQTLRIWELKNKSEHKCKVIQLLQEDTRMTHSLEISRDPNLIGVAFSSDFGCKFHVLVYDRKTERSHSYTIPLPERTGKVHAACFFSGLKTVIIGDGEGWCGVWHLQKRNWIQTWRFGSQICEMAKTSDESLVAIGTWDGTIRLIPSSIIIPRIAPLKEPRGDK